MLWITCRRSRVASQNDAIDNHDQEPWKMPLRLFIEDLYVKRFDREQPERILTIEQIAQEIEGKKEAKRQRKAERRKVAAERDEVPF